MKSIQCVYNKYFLKSDRMLYHSMNWDGIEWDEMRWNIYCITCSYSKVLFYKFACVHVLVMKESIFFLL